MNKLLTKIATLSVGLAMAIGVGVAVASNRDAMPVYAASPASMTSFSALSGNVGGDSNISYEAFRGGGTSNPAINSSAIRLYQNSSTSVGGILVVKANNDVTINSITIRSTLATDVGYKAGYEYKSSDATPLKTAIDNSGETSVSANTDKTFSSLDSSVVSLYCLGTSSSSRWYVSKLSVAYTASESDPSDATLYSTLTIISDPDNLSYYSDATSSEVDYTGASLKAHYYSPSEKPSWAGRDVALTNSDTSLVWTLNMSTLKLIATYTDEESHTATAVWDVTDLGDRPLEGEMSTFTDTSGYVTGTGNRISYAAAQGTAGTAPAVNSGEIRIYQNGGTLTVSGSKGYKLTSITIGSSMATTVTYSVDGGSTSSNQTISAGGTFLLDDIEANSVLFTCTGTDKNSRLYLNYLAVTYKEVEIVYPTHATVEFVSGRGTYYKNGTISDKYTFSTAHVVVKTLDKDENVLATLNDGTGFKLTVNGETLDATSAAQTKSFQATTVGTYPVSVVVEGVGANDTDVNNSSQLPALNLTVVERTPASYEWISPQTTVFYAHRDSFSVDGTLKVTMNDTGSTSSASNFNHVIRAYDENAENHAGAVVELPVHQNGTLNVASETHYVLDMWHKDFETGLHNYTEFTVYVPTLSITDNYDGTYYVGVERTLNVSVVATFEDAQHTQTLSSSEYELRIGGSAVTSVTPANTNAINVTATWIIDGSDALTTASPLVINPEVSTRELNEIAVTDQTLSAGSYFVLSNGAITLDVTEGGVDDLEELSQSQVTITKGAKAYTSLDRIKKSDAGTYTVTYSEGVGNEVSCTFTLTVTPAVVSSISSTTSNVYNKITSIDDLSSGSKYLVVCEGKSVALNGASDTITGNNDTSVDINNDKIVGTNTLDAAVVTITAKDGGYSMVTEGGKYLGHSGSSNSLNTSTTDTFTITIAFDDDGNANIGCNSRVLRRNSSSNQFRYYNSGQTAIQLYKQAQETIYSGSKVAYLESVIDAYRLNSNTEGSVCNADSGLYSSADWTTAKGVYAQLTSDELSEFSSTQDYFGEEGKTYNDTFLMLLSKDPAVINQSSRVVDLLSGGALSTVSVIVIVSLVSLTAIGGYFFLRKKKEN